MAPMRDAVRLVQYRERDLLPAQELDKVFVGQPLGGRVDELHLPGLDFGDETRLLALGQAAVERRGTHATLARLVGLILHERDERRDDERGTVQTKRRSLIAERFAGAARHDGERVPPGQDVFDDLVLAGTQYAHAEGAQRPGERAVLCSLHRKLVEAAGIEPASVSPTQSGLHA